MSGKHSLLNRIVLFGASTVLAAGVVGSAVADTLDVGFSNGPNGDERSAAVTDEFMPLTAAGLMVGRTLVNRDGVKIGRVDLVVRSKADKRVYAVVAIEDPSKTLKDVMIPYCDIKIMPEEVMIRTDLTASDYLAWTPYKPSDYAPISLSKAG
jgi:hypothetical protein